MATKIIPFIFFIFFCFKSFSDELIEILDKESNYAELKIVDKITSKIIEKKLKIKTVNKVKDFEIFIDKCVLDKRKGFLETKKTNLKTVFFYLIIGCLPLIQQ